MLIVTIQFNGCTKKYDYLLDNPENYDIKTTKDIKILKGICKDVPYYSRAHIVQVQSTETIPTHVYSKLLVGENNQVVQMSLGATGKQPTSTAVAPARKPFVAAPKPLKTITITPKRDYRKLERLYKELKEINAKLNEFDRQQAQVKSRLLNYNLEKLFKDKNLPCTNFSGIYTEKEAGELQHEIDQLELEKKNLVGQKQQQLDKIDDFWR